MRRSVFVSCIAAIMAAPVFAAPVEFKSLSGAIGLEDRARMMQVYADYNLHLAFANARGEFLADVRVAIRGADGEVLWRGFSEGPYFFARLPQGHYEVLAEYEGASQSRWVHVGKAPGRMHYFHWRMERAPK